MRGFFYVIIICNSYRRPLRRTLILSVRYSNLSYSLIVTLSLSKGNKNESPTNVRPSELKPTITKD